MPISRSDWFKLVKRFCTDGITLINWKEQTIDICNRYCVLESAFVSLSAKAVHIFYKKKAYCKFKAFIKCYCPILPCRVVD